MAAPRSPLEPRTWAVGVSMLWMLSFICGSSDAVAGTAAISIRMAVARNPFRIVKDYPKLHYPSRRETGETS